MTLDYLGTYTKWAQLDGIRIACLCAAGNVRAQTGRLARAGWIVTKVERWAGSGRGLACYLIAERSTK